MKSAQIIESSGKALESADGEGLFTCLFEHEVKATKATFEWTGPKITPAMWNEVLAFFKWTQDTEKSESQVRLFVHPSLGWMAWAFPQKGGTSMTTKELDTPATAQQRQERIPAGYVAFGTVHHHCNCAAFQSGTDTHDEKSVDGLHITVGNLDAAQYSLHCRFYRRGHKFEPNMAAFWDIGDAMREKIAFVETLGYGTTELADKVARLQLGVPAPQDTAFEPLWKENYILDRPIHTMGVVGESFYGRGSREELDGFWKEQYSPGYSKGHKKGKYKHQNNGRKLFAHEVLEELEQQAIYCNVSKEDLLQAIIDLGDDQNTEIYQAIMEECFKNDIKLEHLFDAAHTQILALVNREAQDEAKQIEDAKEPKTIEEAYGYME